MSRLDFTQIFEFFLLGDFTNVRVDLSCSLRVHYIVIALIYFFLSYRTIQDLLALSTIRQYKEFLYILIFKSSFAKLCLVYENVVG